MIDVAVRSDATVTNPASVSDRARTLLDECFALFRSNMSGFAKLAIDTSNDLFELSRTITDAEVYEFRSKRHEWVKAFDRALVELFDKYLEGHLRQGRRQDADQSLRSLRVLSDFDHERQVALTQAIKQLMEAASTELGSLDYRIATLLGRPPTRAIDNPFSPDYLLDAIGMASRSIYPDPRIWRQLMERVVTDLVPAIGKTYFQLNRFLASRNVLPEADAMLRARSELRPEDDQHLLHVFSKLVNEVHPSLQAWRRPGVSANTSGHINPYIAAASATGSHSSGRAAHFPQVDPFLATGSVAPIVGTLDVWQRSDPFTNERHAGRPVGIDAGVIPVNRIPWIQAALSNRVSDRIAMDVVGFLFDYIFQDPSIPKRYVRSSRNCSFRS